MGSGDTAHSASFPEARTGQAAAQGLRRGAARGLGLWGGTHSWSGGQGEGRPTVFGFPFLFS